MVEKQLRVAVIAAAELPIPASLGGATETMMTNLITRNESLGKMIFHVFSYENACAKAESRVYKNAFFHWYHASRIIDETYLLFWRLLRKASAGTFAVRSRFIKSCIRILRCIDVDVVVIEGNQHQVIQLRKGIQSKLVLHMHTDNLYSGVYHGQQIVKACTRVIAISEYCAKRISTISALAAANTRLLRNSIDVDVFDRNLYTAERNEIRKRYGFTAYDTVFMYSGRIVEDKGILELVRAFKDIECKSAKLLIVGGAWYSSGKETPFMEKLKSEIGDYLNTRIFLTGYISYDAMPAIYASADVNVVPSKCREAAGLSAIEALSTGNPTIVSDMGGLPEYVDEGSSVIVRCDSNFQLELNKAMRKLMNRALAREMGTNARKHARRFNTEVYYNEFYEVIRGAYYD